MKRKVCNMFNVLIFNLMVLASFSQVDSESFIIASGSRGGNYNIVGNFVANEYKFAYPDDFIVIESNGSNENIQLLKNNFADFAIIQRNVLLQSIYNERDGINNVEVVAPIYEEKFLFYLKAEKPVSISELKQILLEKKLKLGFTSQKGYTYNLYIQLFRYLGISRKNVEEKFGDYIKLNTMLEEGNLDGIISFSLPIKILMGKKELQYVYLGDEEANLLEKRIPNLFKTKTNVNQNSFSLGSWTFLVGLRNKIDYFEDPSFLFQSLYESRNDSAEMAVIIRNSINLYIQNKDEWNKKYLKGIPILPAFAEKISLDQTSYNTYMGFLLFVLIIFILFYILRKKNIIPKYSYKYFWYRYQHIIYGILILGILYYVSIFILTSAEQEFYENVGIKSQLLNFSNSDLQFWLFIRNLTGIDNGIAPLSTVGKLIISFTAYILWIGTLLIAFSEFIVYQLNKKRKQGLMKIKFENHIVIIGWSDTTHLFIRNAISEAGDYNEMKEKLVCVISNPEEILEKYPILREYHSEHKLYFVKGEVRDNSTLEKANIQNAKTVVLLAEDNSITSDERTLLRALAIARYSRKKAFKREKENNTIAQKMDYETFKTDADNDKLYIIAEINDVQFKKDLLESDVNEVIVTGSYSKNIITQSMMNFGVSKVIDEILQYNEYNEFYVIDLADENYKHLREYTFDELLLPLRKQGILLIAVKVVYHDKNLDMIIDSHKIQSLLEEEGLKREVIINPITKKEIERKTDADDHLIVFSTDRKTLEERIKKVVIN